MRPPGKIVTGIEADCIAALQAYAWPGNLRELRNIIERAVIVTAARSSRLADLPPGFGMPRASNPAFEVKPGISRQQFVSGLAEHTLAFANGNKAEARRLLGITQKTIHNWRTIAKESSAGT